MEQVLVVNRAALEARLGTGPFLSQNLETIRQFFWTIIPFSPENRRSMTIPSGRSSPMSFCAGGGTISFCAA